MDEKTIKQPQEKEEKIVQRMVRALQLAKRVIKLSGMEWSGYSDQAIKNAIIAVKIYDQLEDE